MRDYTILDAVIEDFYSGLKYQAIIDKHQLSINVSHFNNGVALLKALGLIDKQKRKDSIVEMQRSIAHELKEMRRSKNVPVELSEDAIFDEFMLNLKTVTAGRAKELLALRYRCSVDYIHSSLKRTLSKRNMIKGM